MMGKNEQQKESSILHVFRSMKREKESVCGIKKEKLPRVKAGGADKKCLLGTPIKRGSARAQSWEKTKEKG